MFEPQSNGVSLNTRHFYNVPIVEKGVDYVCGLLLFSSAPSIGLI